MAAICICVAFFFLFFFAGPLYLSCDTPHTQLPTAHWLLWLSVDLGLARPSSLFVPPHCTHARTNAECMSGFHANKRQITCIITQPLRRGWSYFIQPFITPCTDCRPPRCPTVCMFYMPMVQKLTPAAPREAGGRAGGRAAVPPCPLYLVWFLTPRMRARMASWSPR